MRVTAVGSCLLREGGEPLEIGEEDGHLGSALVEVERAEALLVPLAVRAVARSRRTRRASARAIPTTTAASCGERHRDHRLGEQDEGDREGQKEGRAAAR